MCDSKEQWKVMTSPASPSPPIHAIISRLSRLLFCLAGWQVETSAPDLPKFVAIGAPHTSNWDAVVMLFIALILRLRIYWIGKHTLFRPPFGGVLRALGGIPLNRDSTRNAVGQAVDFLNAQECAILVIAPEGTRRRTAHWKTGFYYIAQGAGIPVVLGYVDYRRKRCGLGPAIMPSGDIEADMAIIRDFYRDKTPRHPEKMSEITLPPR